jgi:ankyrin repeat protein
MRLHHIFSAALVLYATAAAADDALHAAVAAQRVAKVDALLKSGADVHAVDDLGRTALHLAVENDQPEMIAVLLRGGASLEAQEDLLGATPLATAVLGRKRKAVEEILKHRPDLDHGTKDPLLFVAAQHGDGAILKMLLDAGMDVRGSITHSTATNVNALMAAAGAGNAETVRVLLERGVDVNQRDGFGDHCLNWAVYFGRFDVVPILLDSSRKVEVNVVGYGGQTALDMAIAKKHAPTIELLKRHGAERASEL